MQLQLSQAHLGELEKLMQPGVLQWYAFDCEFSGLSTGGKPLDYYASLQDRYMKVSRCHARCTW